MDSAEHDRTPTGPSRSGTGADLPPGWTAGRPVPRDVDDLFRVAAAHDRSGLGRPTTTPESVAARVVGPGAQTREHCVVRDPAGVIRAWGEVHDRAAGRTVVAVLVDPGLVDPGPAGAEPDDGTADRVAAFLFDWAEQQGRRLALERGLEATQLDAGAFAGDDRQHRWLTAAGYVHVRTWWQMSRPVEAAEAAADAFPPPGEGITVRQVVRDDGTPDERDLRAVHDVLEAAFTDHFNYHEETFDEFVTRQQQEVGHAWDHWWLAELEDGEPVGALVGEVSAGADGQPDGSYVAYLGVTSAARGRGVARSLLHALISDAAARGRDRVGLEVDADSPTGAVGLYQSMGFRTRYVTESWHRDLVVR
ncbi:GNAT family N-acetyltransferase [Kineosporiaceae bacterium SCSIO 59966]|nr:GNAT family N-acetyltransferase [Kineosporiaceae bacterium SCSIO 59966]